MTKILYVVLAILLFSCKSNSVAQEKGIKNTSSKVEKPKFGDTQSIAVDPNTVHLVAVVQELKKDGMLCDKKFKATTSVRIKRIINSGAGIVNMISAGQEIVFGFVNSPANDFKNLTQDISKDKEVFFKVRENLCSDMSNTMYEVVRYN
ncbi:hypothetical protein [Aquimarina sp. I32.4]|uniref:hypothetical protein n=1 Tax=Aquimarina sp. I32.4 TaxID=2053903 RepID=UPI000CDEF835|nr:hypothetical protein [Aquimarina sp. I32.4]